MGYSDDRFTKNDRRSMRELLDDFNKLDDRFQNSGYDWEQVRDNYGGLAPDEQEFIKEYSRYMDFFDDMRDALDFTKTSTAVQNKFDEKGERCSVCGSLMANVDDYAYIMVTLTGGLNDEIDDLLEWSRTKICPMEDMTYEAYTDRIKEPLSLISVNLAINKCTGNKDVMDAVTVSEIVKVVDYLLRQCELLGISRDNLVNDTIRAFKKADAQGKLAVFPSDDEYDLPEEEDDDDGVITHTFAGHITPITSEDIAAVEEYERRERAAVYSDNITFSVSGGNDDRRERELAEKDRQLAEMSAALKEAREREDRLLAAMEKNQSMYEEMMKKQNNGNDENNNTSKKGFWGRLFGKK